MLIWSHVRKVLAGLFPRKLRPSWESEPPPKYSPVIRGILHSPYFIFLRCAGKYSDSDLLHRFGLPTYRLTQVDSPSPRVIIANDNQWTLIADDWLYTLCYMPSTRPALISLAESWDVFACSVGDSDQGFDFVYYENSRLMRRYVVEQHYDHPKRVVEDIGVPLPGEASAFEQSDELKIVLAIASSLGIKTDYNEQDLRVYSPPD